MGMCKGCNETFFPNEMNNGYCKECYENIGNDNIVCKKCNALNFSYNNFCSNCGIQIVKKISYLKEEIYLYDAEKDDYEILIKKESELPKLIYLGELDKKQISNVKEEGLWFSFYLKNHNSESYKQISYFCEDLNNGIFDSSIKVVSLIIFYSIDKLEQKLIIKYQNGETIFKVYKLKKFNVDEYLKSEDKSVPESNSDKKVLDENSKFSSKKENKNSNADELLKWAELLEKGLIDKEDFDKKKRELI